MSFREELETAPAVEPLSVAEAKERLRVESGFTTDDALIGALIRAARRSVENFTRRFLITQTWKFYADDFPPFESRAYAPAESDVIQILRGKVQSFTHLKYFDVDGVQQTLVVNTDYRVYTSGDDGVRVKPPESKAWPDVQSARLDAVEIQMVLGYGGAATDVPEDIVTAMALLVGDWYENRAQTIIGTISSELPTGIAHILYPYQLPIWSALS